MSSLSLAGGGPKRIGSIDAFRGLTILTMVFVNELSPLRGVPAWMKHAPPKADGMTFVDVVFPAFLFIVGMAIPIALGRRMAAGQSRLALSGHVLLRTLSLLIIGVFMVNMRAIDEAATGMSGNTWTLLAYLGVILVWNTYPHETRRAVLLSAVLRGAGILLLGWLAWKFRGREGDDIVWMRTMWWGILGLIGWAYLVSCLTWLAFRNSPAALVGAVALMTALYIGDQTNALGFLGGLREYISVGTQIGGHGSITMCGVLLSLIVVGGGTVRGRILHMLGLAAALLLGGLLLRPLYGINKNAATPAWCLYSSAISCMVYILLYLAIDARSRPNSCGFLRAAGSNPLLAYILPGIIHSALGVLGIAWLNDHWNEGTSAIIRSAVFAVLIIGAAAGLARVRVRLQL